MSALFNFESLLLFILLLICTCTYLKEQIPRLFDPASKGYEYIILFGPVAVER